MAHVLAVPLPQAFLRASQSVLRQGGLLAVLSFLDFFQTSVQRTAVATAANMCRGLSSENVEAVAAAVPILTNLLQYEVHAICHCFVARPLCCKSTINKNWLKPGCRSSRHQCAGRRHTTARASACMSLVQPAHADCAFVL